MNEEKKLRQEQLNTELVIRPIPISLKKAFKSLCNLRGLTMTQKLVQMIQQEVKEGSHCSKGRTLSDTTEKFDTATTTEKRWTAAEIRKMPEAERAAILEAAAALAEAEYRNNPELTAFEAFGKDDLYGESSGAATR